MADTPINPASGSLQLSSTAPSVVTPIIISVAQAILLLSSAEPDLGIKTVSAAASLVITTSAPLTTNGKIIVVETAADLVVSGSSGPSLGYNLNRSIPQFANLRFSSTAPSLHFFKYITTIASANLAVSGKYPQVTFFDPNHPRWTLSGALTLSTTAPLVERSGSLVPRPNQRRLKPTTYDRHVRRSGDDYAVAFANLLPHGIAWPRESGTVLMRTVRGLAYRWGFVDGRAADLLERESDPRATIELLPDWERNWGLPDPCMTPPQTIAARQAALVQRMTLLGAQSREWFYEVASWVGFTDVTITEFAPFMVGVSRVGDTKDLYDDVHYRWQLGAPEMRFYWTFRVDALALNWFRVGGGGSETGIHHHLEIVPPEDFQCLMERWKPLHTEIIFDFSVAVPGRLAFDKRQGAKYWYYFF